MTSLINYPVGVEVGGRASVDHSHIGLYRHHCLCQPVSHSRAGCQLKVGVLFEYIITADLQITLKLQLVCGDNSFFSLMDSVWTI